MHIRAKLCRKALGLSQQQVADAIGIEQPNYAKFELGRVKSPAFIEELSTFYKCSPGWLHYGEGFSPEYLANKEIQEYRSGKVPLVIWHQIPNIYNHPELLFDKTTCFIDITFQTEKDLFASIIPKTIIPGKSTGFFQPDDMLLISPTRKPNSAQYIVIQEEGWLEPIFVQYWVQGDTPAIKLDSDLHLRKLTDDIQICGVVVARLNIFI